MAVVTMHWEGDGIARLTAAVDKLAGPQSRTVQRRAINHTLDKVHTIVVRTLSKQIGAPQAVIKRYGMITKIRASNATLTATILCKGGPIPLKHFRAYQTRKGVSAAPWKNRKTYKSAFIVPSLGGHAYWRVGRKRLPIKNIAGPNVPKEIVKDATAAAFQATTSASLPRRIEHELKRLTGGVLS